MRPRPPPAAPSMAGFTLVEVLVGLALLAMLMTVILASIRLGTGIWTQAEVRTGDLDAMTAVQSLLRQTIGSARPAFASDDPSNMTILFAGEANMMRLVAPRPASQDVGPWTLLTLHLVRTGGTGALVLSWFEGQPARPRDERLIDHVASLRLAYFGPTAPGGPAEWQSRWVRADKLPALVRLQVERDTSSLPDWPDLVVATRINANAICMQDAAGNGCRRLR